MTEPLASTLTLPALPASGSSDKDAEEMLPPVVKPTEEAVISIWPPLPEVTEGNTEADWSLWEDSVNSQLQPLSGFQDAGVRDTESGDITAFDQVGKRDR